MEQDFSRKISIVVDKTLPNWQVLNTVAHISANFGNALQDNFSTGEAFITQNNIKVPRNTQYPIIVLQSDHSSLQEFAIECQQSEDIEVMYFIKEMIETSNDNAINNSVKQKDFAEIEFLGVGIFGKNEIVKKQTNQFELWS
jgi:hypothetical protein